MSNVNASKIQHVIIVNNLYQVFNGACFNHIHETLSTIYFDIFDLLLGLG
jgi:hypothetical protein